MTAYKTIIDVVIPCFRVREHILDVVEEILQQGVARNIIVVDDACPENTYELVSKVYGDRNNVIALKHDNNQGVGGAVLTGYQYAFDHGADIVVKVDGDGQMDPKFIPHLTDPIIQQRCDYSKGNRFFFPKFLTGMPKIRFIGNSILSLVNKFTSGYWSLMDPTNGFTALHRTAYSQLQPETLSRDYFFESDMLFQLGIANAVVLDIPMPAIYGSEKSNLVLPKILFRFPGKYISRLLKRIAFKYFIREFNIASLEIMFGLLLFGGGLTFGCYQWITHLMIGEETPAGTVMIFGITVILGFQLLLSALNYDISHEPAIPLVRRDAGIDI